jgi:4-amino-4-deoxy-L-arabinose transferase-like glycosyltransferase
MNPVGAVERSVVVREGVEACRERHYEWIVILVAAIIFLSGIISPPSLMDDVDASQALMARNMLQSGDWVTARLDGVAYLDKAPLKYWVTVILYKLLGPHDWVARIPTALGVIFLCWLLYRIGAWAFSKRAGFYAGLFLSTCIGLFLFTRIVIPDLLLTLSITVAVWGVLRALDEREEHPRRWAYITAISLAAGLLLKGLIGIAFPIGAAFFYLLFTRQIFSRRTWQRLYPFTSFLVFLVFAAPWHVLAAIRNPPVFCFKLASVPGEYHGFFWFYFINEQLLRFLNLRYPRDYNTVPRLYFWLLNLVWLFPWSVFLPQAGRLKFRPVDRAGRTRFMLLCWIGVVMVFFTFSTTQEYYSMPIYPAMALLLGCGIAEARGSLRLGSRIIAVLAGCAAVAICGIMVIVRNLPTPGDISSALTQNPNAYTLSMGHMQDLTFHSFAYLRLPLLIAGIAFAIGAIGAWRLRGERALLAIVVMMTVFFQAARLALVVFDPYLSTHAIAKVLNHSPEGTLIVHGEHNDSSALFFYARDKGLIWNGRSNSTLEYGSYAPDAPHVFIEDADFSRLWAQNERFYLALRDENIPRVLQVVPRDRLHLVAAIGGRSLFSNKE